MTGPYDEVPPGYDPLVWRDPDGWIGDADNDRNNEP